MRKEAEGFINVAFFICLVIMILFIIHKKNEEVDKECNKICAPLQHHVKFDGVGYKCACEERNPGVIRFRDGRTH